MTKGIHKLTHTKVKSISKKGRHSDGGGLYLNVAKGGSKSWIVLYTFRGQRREKGLGSFRDVSLADARDMAAIARKKVLNGQDPIEARTKSEEPNFHDCAIEYLAAKNSGWKHPKHRQQWRMTLIRYAEPLHALRVSDITNEDVLLVLEPIWMEKSETASRLRGRIEAVLDYAKVKGWRSGENPAAWRGNLKSLLPDLKRSQRVVHFPAMPFSQIADFMIDLRLRTGLAAKLLEFTILTASRSSEARCATWSEIDLEAKTWRVPAHRMKAGREHVVPLSSRAHEILLELQKFKVGDFVFPNLRTGNSLSDSATRALLHRMKCEDITTHGFRSTFRDWAGDCTNAQREVIEACLAHGIKNSAEAAYRRSSALQKRRKVMEDWAQYCEGVSNVIEFAAA